MTYFDYAMALLALLALGFSAGFAAGYSFAKRDMDNVLYFGKAAEREDG